MSHGRFRANHRRSSRGHAGWIVRRSRGLSGCRVALRASYFVFNIYARPTTGFASLWHAHTQQSYSTGLYGLFLFVVAVVANWQASRAYRFGINFDFVLVMTTMSASSPLLLFRFQFDCVYFTPICYWCGSRSVIDGSAARTTSYTTMIGEIEREKTKERKQCCY